MYRAVQAAQVITNPQDHTDVKFEEEEVQMIPQPFVLAEKSYSTIVESERKYPEESLLNSLPLSSGQTDQQIWQRLMNLTGR